MGDKKLSNVGEMEAPVKQLTPAEKRAVKKHLRQVKRKLYQNLIKAYKGWWYWHTLMRKYKKKDIKNTAVILIPDTNLRDGYLALLYLEKMISQHKFKKALILTHNEIVKESAQFFSKRILDVVHCPRDMAEKLMQFYCLYEFDKRFFCASLDEPYGRNGSRMIGAKGVTAEEIFAIGVYRIYPYEKQRRPGHLDEIGRFFREGEKLAQEGGIDESVDD